MTLVLPTPRLALGVAFVAIVTALSPLFPVLLGFALALAAMLAGAALADVVLGPQSHAIRVSRLVPERLAQLIPTPVTYVLENISAARLLVRAVDGSDHRLEIDPQPFSIVLDANESSHVAAAWTGIVRGDVTLSRIDLAVRNAIGLFERRYRVDVPAQIAVVPPHGVLDRGNLATRNRLTAFGLRRIERIGAGTDFDRLRAYTPGDSFRRINWKATARRGGLIVAEDRAERSQHVIVVLDCGRLMSGRIDQRSKLDYALDAALALSRVCLLAGDSVGFCAFADRELRWLGPKSHSSQFASMREAGYDLQPLACESDYARAAGSLSKHVSKRALFVLLSDVFDPDQVRETVGAFRLLLGNHLVFLALMNDAAFETAAATEPRDRASAFEAGTALALLDERRHAVARLRSLGFDVKDVAPSTLAGATVESYLSIKALNRL